MKTKNKRNFKLPSLIMVVLTLFLVNSVAGQSLEEENQKVVKQANKLLATAEENLAENDFPSAEASYRKAVSKDPESVKAKYNMANMYYGKERASQAESRLKQAAKIAGTKEEKHKIFHNLGNTFMEQKKYKEAVESYKNALRNNPNDEETRYNLALAKKMLEEEEKNNEGGGGEDEQEKQDEKNKEQDKQDKGEQEQEKQDGEDQEDQGGDPKEDSEKEPQDKDDKGEPKDQKEEEGNPEQQPQQPQPGQLSPQQIKSLLEAMNNEEKKVQDKINLEKAKGAKTRTGKDW